MFETIDVPCKGEKFIIRDKNNINAYLHSDGSVFKTPEYWPTREVAQVILDKFQPPKPKHVWRHGDVFERENGAVLIYLVVSGGPLVYCLRPTGWFAPSFHPDAAGLVDECLKDAKFLFNVREKL
jgi:hypothetical protein